jgi:tetratricopeptide (TPR) repeat protein
MGFRARRSIKIAPGVRMNVSAKSIGLSAGVKGASVSANSSGRVTRTVGIPGTGISHVKSTTAGSKKSAPRSVAQPAPPAPKAIKPGMLAPKWEKALFKQISETADGPTLHRLAQDFPEANRTITLVEVLYVAIPANDQSRVRALLNWLFDVSYEPDQDPFVSKYLPGRSLSLPIAEGISASIPLSSAALALFLAEIEQQAESGPRAIEVVESLEPTTIAAVSLAELYSEAERWADVVELTNGVTNEDEPSTYLLIQRGAALREQGYADASRESLKEALRVRSRPSELRNLALIERGKTYLSENKKAMARKDFERVMADHAGYPGLQDLIAAAS